MSIYIDTKYVNLLSLRLDRFVRKQDYLWNFRCPICGDSSKNKYKARGYVYRKTNDLFFRCHNCGAGMSVGNLVKFVDESLYRQYALERYKDGENGKSNYQKPTEIKDFIKPVFKTKLNLESIDRLHNDHYAKQYLMKRKIPKQFLSDLYYAPDFRTFVDELAPNHGKDLKANDPRIIIPFYDKDKNLIAIQGRALEADSKTRYMTIKLDEHHPKIYGLERFDKSKKSYILEGPFDSMFIPNSLAAAGSNLKDLTRFVDINNTTFVYDNQPRNKEIVRVIGGILDNGYKVCIWPDFVIEKDINDMILNGFNISEILHIIDNNSFNGLEGKFRLQSWKKV